MSPEDIHDLLTRLAIFPKPYPRTIEGAVKAIERQRWVAIQAENEWCAKMLEWIDHEVNAESEPIEHECVSARAAAAIRARVKS